MVVGYKSAKARNTTVVITLDIPNDAMTNLNRSTIVDATKAKYRTNKAKVVSIQDSTGKSYRHAVSHYDKPITYTLGKTVTVDNYNQDVYAECTSGIHFFLDKELAEKYITRPDPNYTGGYCYYYPNGQKCEEGTLVNGEHEGLNTTWYENGQKWEEENYVAGELNGLYTEWHDNGQKWVEATYVAGKLNGLYTSWHANGQKMKECNYVAGELSGFYTSWHPNGQKFEESTYVAGKPDGLCTVWDYDGKKFAEGTYVAGEKQKVSKKRKRAT